MTACCMRPVLDAVCVRVIKQNFYSGVRVQKLGTDFDQAKSIHCTNVQHEHCLYGVKLCNKFKIKNVNKTQQKLESK